MMIFSSKLELAKLNYRVRIMIRDANDDERIVNHH